MAYPQPENLTNMAKVMRYADNVSSGYYGIGCLIALFFVIFLYLRARGGEAANCFVVASFITTIASVMFFLMELINSKEFFICVLVLALSIVWSLLSKD